MYIKLNEILFKYSILLDFSFSLFVAFLYLIIYLDELILKDEKLVIKTLVIALTKPDLKNYY